MTFDLKNTGSREGAEVAQVYISDKQPAVPHPAKELKGFSKVTFKPGESKSVTIPLDRRALSYFDTGSRRGASTRAISRFESVGHLPTLR